MTMTARSAPFPVTFRGVTVLVAVFAGLMAGAPVRGMMAVYPDGSVVTKVEPC